MNDQKGRMSNRQSGRRIQLIGVVAILAGALQVESSLEMFAQLLSSKAETPLKAILVYAAICIWLLAYTLISFRSKSSRIPAKEKSFLGKLLIFIYILVMGFFYSISRGVETEVGLLHRFIAFAMIGIAIVWVGVLILLGYIE